MSDSGPNGSSRLIYWTYESLSPYWHQFFVCYALLNPSKPNVISHYYQLDQSICWVVFFFGDSDQMPHFAASDLGQHCLSMSHKKDARLKWVNNKCIKCSVGGVVFTLNN